MRVVNFSPNNQKTNVNTEIQQRTKIHEIQSNAVLTVQGEPQIRYRNRKLKMNPHEWLVPIGEGYPELEKEYLSLEPAEMASQSGQSAALDSIRLRWRREMTLVPLAKRFSHEPGFSSLTSAA